MRSRAGKVVALSVAVVVACSAVVTALASSWYHEEAVSDPPSVDAAATPTAAREMVPMMRAVLARTMSLGGLSKAVPPQVAAFDGNGALMPSGVVAKASAIETTMAVSPVENLAMRVAWAPGDAEGDPESHCEIGIEIKAFVACTFEDLGPGVTAIYKHDAHRAERRNRWSQHRDHHG